MKVKFANGYQTEMRDEVAKVYIAKGRAKKVVEKESKPAPRPKKTDAPKAEPKEDGGKE